jgi:hypothetical protein
MTAEHTSSPDSLYLYEGVEDLYESKPFFSLAGRAALRVYEGAAALPARCIDRSARTITLNEEDSLGVSVPAYSEFLLHTTAYEGAALQMGKRLSEIIAKNTRDEVFEDGHRPQAVVQIFSEHDPNFAHHPKFKFNLSLEKVGQSKLIWATFGEAWESIAMSPRATDELAPTPWRVVRQDSQAKYAVPVISPSFLLFMEAAAQKFNGSSPEVVAEFQSTFEALAENPLWAEDVTLAKERYDAFVQDVRERYPYGRDVRGLLGKRSARAVVHSGVANAQLWRSSRKNTSK